MNLWSEPGLRIYIYIYLKQLTSVFLGKGQSIATEVKETTVARRVWCLRPAYANWLNWNVFVHQHLILKCLLNKADCRTDVLVLWCISSNIFSLKKCASPSSVWSHQESAIQNWQIKHHLPDNNLHRTLRYRWFTQSWDKSMEGRRDLSHCCSATAASWMMRWTTLISLYLSNHTNNIL